MYDYYIIYKPFQVLSQFTSQEGKRTLKDFCVVPRDVYPVGRLDYDSEGLLLLTIDSSLTHRLLHPSFEHEREYRVQVKGDIDPPTLARLAAGLLITVEGKPYRTKTCKAEKMVSPESVPERQPPIRYRKNIPSSWLSLTLTEGKNRQVRKMTAKVGFPTLRLIRFRIGGIKVEGPQPGEVRKMSRKGIYLKLFAASSATD